MELAGNTAQDLGAGVLHALRLKGRATEAALAAALGVSTSDIEEVLRQGQQDGWYTQRTGRLAGWLLTPAGQQRWADQHAAERSAADVDRLMAGYDTDFLALNRAFKQLCTSWQLVGDREATATALACVHRAIGDQLAEFSALVPRFAGYRPRFEAALRRFVDGENNALLQPLTDSYHDIWLELHEDLLVLLEKQRDADD